MNLRLSLSVSLVALGACVPTLDDPTSRVSAPRILAIRAVPPEAAPNQNVQLTALYADRTGTLTTGPVSWTYCNTRKPLAELGPVARACFDPASADQVAIGMGLSVSGKLPREACRLFGPNPPPAMMGEPSGRPVDPDITGGYYQPSIAFSTMGTETDPTLGQVRIACPLANAEPQVGIEYGLRYRRNENPVLAAVSIDVGGASIAVPTEGAGTPPVVAPGSTFTISVAWPECPIEGACGDGICGDDENATDCSSDCAGSTPPGCGGSETYVHYDSQALSLERLQEAMHVTWYANAGAFDAARTGRARDDHTASSDNLFTTPSTAGDFVIWVVLRDERGGTEFGAYRLTVAP